MDWNVRQRAQQLLENHIVFGSDRDATAIAGFMSAGGTDARLQLYDLLRARWLFVDVTKTKPQEVVKAMKLFGSLIPRSNALRKRAAADLQRLADIMLAPKSAVALQFQDVLWNLAEEFPGDFEEVALSIARAKSLSTPKKPPTIPARTPLTSDHDIVQTATTEANDALQQVDDCIHLLLDGPTDETALPSEVSDKNITLLQAARECLVTANLKAKQLQRQAADSVPQSLSVLQARLAVTSTRLESLTGLLVTASSDDSEEEFEDVVWE